MQALAQTGDPKAVPVLEALNAGDLYVRKSDNKIFIAKESGGNYALTDPVTGQPGGRGAARRFRESPRQQCAAPDAGSHARQPDPAQCRPEYPPQRRRQYVPSS